MDLFNSLPLKKQEYMNRLFRNCTEEVKYYMSVIDVEADQTFIKAEEVGISIKTLDRNIRKLEEMNLLTLNKGKIVITKAQYFQMKQDIDFYVNG